MRHTMMALLAIAIAATAAAAPADDEATVATASAAGSVRCPPRTSANEFTSAACMSKALRDDGYLAQSSALAGALDLATQLADFVAAAASTRRGVPLTLTVAVPSHASENGNLCRETSWQYDIDSCSLLQCGMGEIIRTIGKAASSLLNLGFDRREDRGRILSTVNGALTRVAQSGWACANTGTPSTRRSGRPLATYQSGTGSGAGFSVLCDLGERQIQLIGGGGGGGGGFSAGAYTYSGGGGSGAGFNAIDASGNTPAVGGGGGGAAPSRVPPALVPNSKNEPLAFAAGLRYILSTRVPLCLRSGGKLIVTGGGGGGGGGGGELLPAPGSFNTGWSFVFGVNTTPDTSSNEHIVYTLRTTHTCSATVVAPRSAISATMPLSAALQAAALVESAGATLNQLPCSDNATLDLRGPAWLNEVKPKLSPFLAASGPVFEVDAAAERSLLQYAEPVYWSGASLKVSWLKWMAVTGAGAGFDGPEAAFHDNPADAFATNSSTAKTGPARLGSDIFISAATKNAGPAVWAYAASPSSLDLAWVFGRGWPAGPGAALNISSISSPVVAPNGALLVAATLGKDQWATKGLAAMLIALDPHGTVVAGELAPLWIMTANPAVCSILAANGVAAPCSASLAGAAPGDARVGSFIASATPLVVDELVVFMAAYETSSNDTRNHGLLALELPPTAPKSALPAVHLGVTNGTGYFDSTVYSPSYLLQRVGASRTILVTFLKAYGTAFSTTAWTVPPQPGSVPQNVSITGWPGSVPTFSARSSGPQLLYILTKDKSITTFAISPRPDNTSDLVKVADQTISNLDTASDLQSYGTSLVLAPVAAANRMLVVISTTATGYTPDASNGAAVLGSYPLAADGTLQPPPPGQSGLNGVFCVFSRFASYATPGAAYRMGESGRLTVQFAQPFKGPFPSMGGGNATIGEFSFAPA